MREILFRGKSKYTGRWMYGYYAKATHCFGTEEGPIIISLDSSVYYNGNWSGGEFVIPETVGQYIGYEDKNGKKIFEGDIVKECWGGIIDDNKPGILVRWEDDSCGFEPFSDSTENCGHCGGGMSPCNCVVVGNIHDNPKMPCTKERW